MTVRFAGFLPTVFVQDMIGLADDKWGLLTLTGYDYDHAFI
ncbi:hypothetical protein [uncultured Shimia sp.]|nr:hypothetical protein [uncultured Shimia sp.]